MPTTSTEWTAVCSQKRSKGRFKKIPERGFFLWGNSLLERQQNLQLEPAILQFLLEKKIKNDIISLR